MYKVKIGADVYNAAEGELLADVLRNNGIYIHKPCGGKGLCGKCKVTVNGESVLACSYKIRHDIAVSLPQAKPVFEANVSQNAEKIENPVFALDIGTTTLALALVSRDSRKAVEVLTSENPQTVFGADVISRIEYCRDHSVKDLQHSVVSHINTMLDSFDFSGNADMYVSGNTVMLHILFGVDPSPMGTAPYTPSFCGIRAEDGANIGMPKIRKVVSLPCISAFVGADLVAGINCAGMPPKGKYNLLVDLGTNAEIVLFSGDSVLCTSAAAGPCFEGAGITCGMNAVDGAIYRFVYCGLSKPRFKTISEKPAKGICATGLVDIIAELLRRGEINKDGFLRSEKFVITDTVFLTRSDVRQYQLAKSAVFSALIVLLKTAHVDFSEIANLYVSGGFSSELNVKNAVFTGLLPKELKEKTHPLNNSSLAGTVKYACDNNLGDFLKNARYTDLSETPDFAQLFINNIEF